MVVAKPEATHRSCPAGAPGGLSPEAELPFPREREACIEGGCQQVTSVSAASHAPGAPLPEHLRHHLVLPV